MTDRSFPNASSCLWNQLSSFLFVSASSLSLYLRPISSCSFHGVSLCVDSPLTPSLLFPPSRNVGNVRNVRNLVNVGRWRNGHTLHTLRENMETKLHQRFLLVNRYGFYVKNRNRFYSYRFHVYVTFLPYTWNVYVKIFTYTWFSTLHTLTTYVTWRWKSRVTLSLPTSNLPVSQFLPTADPLPFSRLTSRTIVRIVSPQLYRFFMVALCNRADHYIFILFLSSFFFFFFLLFFLA